MSNAWGTLSQHNENVQRQLNAEKGIVAPERTEEETTEDEPKVMAVEAPTVVLPDGRTVPVAEYDPFEKERAKMNSVTVDGILQYLSQSNNGKDSSNDENTPEPEPKFKPFSFGEDDLPDETDQKMAEHLNSIGSMFAESSTEQEAKIDKLVEAVDTLSKSVGRKFLDDEIASVSARTGFTEDELLAGNQETGLDDPYQVALFLKGKKQEAEDLKKAQDEADAKRASDISGVAGTTGGGTTVGAGGGNVSTQIMQALLGAGLPISDEMVGQLIEAKNLPEKLDYNNPEEVGKYFKFGNV